MDADDPLGEFRVVAPRRDGVDRARRLGDGERLILYTDGISRRRTADGLFGVAGIVEAARTADPTSATATARAVQEAVVSASEDALPDDAAIVVLAPRGAR